MRGDTEIPRVPSPRGFGREDISHPDVNALPVARTLPDFVDSIANDLPAGWCEDCMKTSNLCPCLFTPHSGTTDDNMIMKVTSNSSQQNVDFTDNDDPYMYSVKGSMDPTRSLQDTTSDGLGDFFGRPIKIYTKEWLTATELDETLDPWSLFLQNPRVSNRMTNYNLMRAKMHVKIMINGNSFHYGRAMALYHPQHTRDDFTNLSLRPSLVQGSQMPHVFIDPTTSTGGELCLPFFCETNNIHLPSGDWGDLGRVHIISLNQLRHAGGASDKATITVFAWLEEVQLNMLTSVDMPLQPQSGSEIDEANAKGIVSGPATTVAKFAATMAEVPVIGPFAMATSQAATMTAGVAKLMGYSRPSVTKDPEPFKPAAISSLATTTTPDGVQKLTIDDKQELSIDPAIAGIGSGDPLNIHQIAKRESYLTTFPWDMGKPPETMLWNSLVNPTNWAVDGSAIYLPALAMAAMPFKYWTGSLKFRFQIVCSAFHKGRIKVVYDPNYIDTNEYNVNYIEIIDIAEKQDFTIEIGNGQNRSLLTSLLPGGDSLTEAYSATSPLGALQKQGNGVLSMYIVNELTTPDSSADHDIAVNVYVSAGDDFEVFVPDDRFQAYSFKPQSGFEPQSGSEDVNDALVAHDPSPPQQETSEVLGVGATNHVDLNKVYIGETIKSFRPLLKRYNLHTILNATLSTDRRVLYGRRTAFPFLKGRVGGAVHQDENGVAFNYCNTILLHWVTLAFQGYRGSMRWKITPQCFLQHSNLPIMQVQRDISSRHYYNGRSGMPSPQNESEMASLGCNNLGLLPDSIRPFGGVKGMALAVGNVNPNLEFEVPFYSVDRFVPGKRENYTTTFGLEDDLNVFDYRIFTQGVNETLFDAYCATGEDFQVYFWTGLPKVYYTPFVPAAG